MKNTENVGMIYSYVGVYTSTYEINKKKKKREEKYI